MNIIILIKKLLIGNVKILIIGQTIIFEKAYDHVR